MTTDDKSVSDLLPCPFCGHEAVHQNHSARPGEFWYANSFVRCPVCRASGPVGSQDEAVVAWNRRPPPSGYRLVPVEPTEAMIGAGLDSLKESTGANLGFIDRDPLLAYRAMLHAAPQSTEGK